MKKLISYNIAHNAHMAQNMTHRIPVSEARWKELGQIKQAGQTYDELLEEMIVMYNRAQLVKKARDARLGKGTWHKLEKV